MGTATKAKKNPARYTHVAMPNIIQLTLRNLLHALALVRSAGQGAKRARHCNAAADTIKIPATANIISLCADIAVIHGVLPTIPASAAPMPIVTNKASRALQSSVPIEVNKPSDDRIVCRHSSGSLFIIPNTPYIITRICNQLNNGFVIQFLPFVEMDINSLLIQINPTRARWTLPIPVHPPRAISATPALGLIHMNGRVYDPEVGRFLSADPFIQAHHFRPGKGYR